MLRSGKTSPKDFTESGKTILEEISARLTYGPSLTTANKEIDRGTLIAIIKHAGLTV